MSDLLDPITQLPRPEPKKDGPWYPTLDSIDAGMQRQNPLSRWSADIHQTEDGIEFPMISSPDFPAEDGYVPFDDPATEAYDNQHFLESYSAKQTQYIIKKIEQNRSLNERAGITGEILGAVTNPILTIPAIMTGGSSIPTMMAVEGGAEILNEVILHSQQPLRTKTESAINASLAMGVTGVIGAIGNKISKNYAEAHRSDWAEEIEAYALINDIDPANVTMADVEALVGSPATGIEGTVIGEGAAAGVRDERSAGSAEVRAATPEGERMVGGKIKRAIAETLAQGPLARVLSGASVKAKVLAQRLADIPFILNKHLRGETSGPSIESKMGKYEGLKYQGFKKAKELFKDYKNKNPNSGMSFRDFDMQVGKAMSNNDVHPIPQVQATAKWYRSNVLDPLLKDAQDLSLLPGTKGYYKRQMEIAKYSDTDIEVGRALGALEDEIVRLDKQLPSITAALAKVEAAIKKTESKLAKKKSVQLEDELKLQQKKLKKLDAKAAAQEARRSGIEKQLKLARQAEGKTGQSSYATHLARKFDEAPDQLHTGAISYFPRIFNSEKIIQNYDTLHTAISKKLVADGQLSEIEARNVAKDIIRNLLGGDPLDAATKKAVPTASALKERTLNFSDNFLEPYLEKDATSVLGRHLESVGREVEFAKEFSGKRLDTEIGEIADEYQVLIDAAGKRKDTKKAKALAKEKDQTITDLLAMRDRLMGTYGRPADPSTALVRAGRAARLANATAMLGGVTLSSLADIARPITMQALGPFLKGIMNIATNWKTFNLSRNEMKKWGVGLEAAMGDARLAQIADLNDLGRVGRATMDVFGKLTGLSYWNAGLKQFTGVIATDTILGAATRGKVGKALRTRLARAGINEEGLRAIGAQFKKHGTTERGLRLANTNKWDDEYAREVLESAIRSEVNMTIVTPGVGDAPLFMSSEMGKLVTQFKSFLMSATNRMLVNSLQRADIAVLQGTIASVAMGALVGGIKAELRGKDTSEWDAEKWALEGIDRSGILGIYNIPYNMALTLAGKTQSRNIQRSVANQLTGDMFGPTLGQIQRAAGVFADFATGEADENTVEQMSRLAPLYNNLNHIRQIAERINE